MLNIKVVSVLCGTYVGLVFVPIDNSLARRCATPGLHA